MTKKYFSEGLETPNALKMYLDHITNIEIIPLPSPEYDTETRDMYGNVIPSDEELDSMIMDVLDDEDIMESTIKEHDEVDMGDYTYDSSESEIEFTLGEFEVEGNYNREYEDLFYHIEIKKNGKKVYQNDYGKEKHDNNEITDEQVDEILDLLITYAVEADPTINENFEVVNEGRDITFTDAMLDKLRKEYSTIKTIDPDGPTYKKMTKYLDNLPDVAIKQLAKANVKYISPLALNRAIRRGIKLNESEINESSKNSNLDLIQNMKGKEITLKFKNGDEMNIDSADARILIDFYKKLPDNQKTKFAELLDKSTSGFLMAYNQAMK